MSAAGFVLVINIFVAGLFVAAFGVLAMRSPRAMGARWLTLAYAIGVLNAALELLLPVQADARLLALVVFAVALSAFLVCVIGLARHYEGKVPWIALAVLGIGSVIANALVISTPTNTSLAHGMVYQLPYLGAHLLGAWVVFRASRLQALDVTLIVFLCLSGTQFIAKPFLALMLGSGGSEHYLQSLYGAYSQLLTAFLLITNGVLMLLIIVRDVMAEITERSETDTLSQLLNRRGFEDHADKLLATIRRAGVPASMVVADLDHFKVINDTHGHEAGDRVIAGFAQVLRAIADQRSVLGRMGGEEFVAFIPGSNVATARLFAEGVRNGFSGLDIALLGPEGRVSASFGVAQLRAGDSLSDLMRRADAALYEAKKSGRDRVVVSAVEPAAPLVAGHSVDRRKGSRRLP